MMTLLKANPFLFIRGLSKTSLTHHCLELTMSGYPYNLLPVSCGDTSFLKKPWSSIGLEIRPQSASTAFRALLPSKNYSAE
jgi:hypothetical protein